MDKKKAGGGELAGTIINKDERVREKKVGAHSLFPYLWPVEKL
jgi:hypothetical protein